MDFTGLIEKCSVCDGKGYVRIGLPDVEAGIIKIKKCKICSGFGGNLTQEGENYVKKHSKLAELLEKGVPYAETQKGRDMGLSIVTRYLSKAKINKIHVHTIIDKIPPKPEDTAIMRQDTIKRILIVHFTEGL